MAERLFYASQPLSCSSVSRLLHWFPDVGQLEWFHLFTHRGGQNKDMNLFARLHLKWIFFKQFLHIQLRMATNQASVDGPLMG